MNQVKYMAGRIPSTVAVLFTASILIFLLVRFIPGDVASLIAGEDATIEQVREIRERLRLNEPLFSQYTHWIIDALRFEFGDSYVNGIPVAELIKQRLAPTAQIAAGGILAAMTFGFSAGIVAGLRPGRGFDKVLSWMNTTSLSIPSFWMGYLLLLLFGLTLGWFPLSGYTSPDDGIAGTLHSLVLPSVTLGLGIMPTLSWLIRDGLIANRERDFVRTGYAMGLPRTLVVRRYLLRNSVIPVITVMGLVVGRLISGAVVVEAVFAIPGLGSLAIDAVKSHDYPTIQAVILLAVVMFVASNTAADIIHALIDPRVVTKQP